MLDSPVRMLGMLIKELNEIRRQPRLLISLIFGPFVILMLFGAGYQSSLPTLDTAIVFPQDQVSDELADHIRNVIGTNAAIVNETSDREEALQLLRNDQVDVVKAMPEDALQRLDGGEQSTISVYSNSINPQVEDWIEYLAFAETNELNKGILREMVARTQEEARTRRSGVTRLRDDLGSLDRNLSAERRAELADQIGETRQSLALLAIIAPLLENGPNEPPSPEEIAAMNVALSDVEQMLESDQLDDREEDLSDTVAQLTDLEQALGTYSDTPANVIVSPLRFEYENIRGQSYNITQYFLPAVLALLVQHLGIALGALAMVRERLIGATEMFQVAPISTPEIVIGKSLAYLFLAVIMVAGLAALLPLLNLPITGRLIDIAVLTILLSIAALGVGFLISSISTTESQAVQLALLALLLSIFFGNFFLPLESFWRPVQIIGQVLPLTHGVNGLQAILLRDQRPEAITFWALGGIAAVTFLSTFLILRLTKYGR